MLSPQAVKHAMAWTLETSDSTIIRHNWRSETYRRASSQVHAHWRRRQRQRRLLHRQGPRFDQVATVFR